jgi:RNA polymerase sigma-70 factor (ECF subfamily)
MMTKAGNDTIVRTRRSLLGRLHDLQDQTAWREFFDSYWRLIYKVARSAELNDAEAQDVVQNTFIYLSRRMPNFRYDPERGAFKSWLRVVTRSRINVFLRQQKADEKFLDEPQPGDEEDGAGELEEIPDPAGDALDEVWQREWEENLLARATRGVRARVSAQHFLIFRLSTLNQLPLKQVAKKLHLSLPQVYLVRHRVARLFKEEVQRLRRETE